MRGRLCGSAALRRASNETAPADRGRSLTFPDARQLHRPRSPFLLPPHRDRARGRPRAPPLGLSAGRRARRSRLRHVPAGHARVPRGRVDRALHVGVRSPPPGHVGVGGRPLGHRPRRGRLLLLLVAPREPRGERALGGARGAPPERGLQPRGRAAAGHPDELHRPALLRAAGAARRAAHRVRVDERAEHALPVLDPHRAVRQARLGRGLAEHAEPSPRPPCGEPPVSR